MVCQIIYIIKKPPPAKEVVKIVSGKRDSNPRPRPWQGRALPTELFLHRFGLQIYNRYLNCAR